MRRLLLGFAAALAPLAVLVPPVAADPAEPTVDVVIGYAADDFQVVEVPAARAAEVIADARRDDDVQWAEVDVPMHAAAAPNDPLFVHQWGLARTGAPDAWSTTTGAADVLVAVVDTGVDAGHPDLAGRVDPEVVTIGDGRTGDPNGHGTGVAGVVAAAIGNGVGIAGYCGRCRVLPVRALDADGAGTSSSVANGIVAAADRGADVINLSLAGQGTSVTLQNAVAYARQRGAVVIAAAGNSGLSTPHSPAADPGVIGVVATNQTDSRYSWSNYGTWNDVAAPGCAATFDAEGYYEACGTSFAAPAVAGAVALAMAAAPDATAQSIEAALLTSASPIAAGLVSAGRLDTAALVRASTALPTAPAPAPAPTGGGGGGGGTATAPAPVEDDVVEAPVPADSRIAGENRIATAVALSERVRSAATDVVIARADAYADALAAAPLAGALDAPVLLTPSASLSSAVADEIGRLGATKAWVIGGTGAISSTVTDQLRAAGITEVRRLAGADRADTARRIAVEVGGTSAIIAAADGWADAVAVSALAAQTQTPILLASRTGLPAATVAALDALGVTRITVVGGTAAVPDAAAAAARALGATVTRIAGATRYATSAAVAEATVGAGADPAAVWAATGRDWPDALAAGPAAAASGAVLVLVDGVDAGRSPETLEWVRSHARGVTVVGGDASISSGVFSALRA